MTDSPGTRSRLWWYNGTNVRYVGRYEHRCCFPPQELCLRPCICSITVYLERFLTLCYFYPFWWGWLRGSFQVVITEKLVKWEKDKYGCTAEKVINWHLTLSFSQNTNNASSFFDSKNTSFKVPSFFFSPYSFHTMKSIVVLTNMNRWGTSDEDSYHRLGMSNLLTLWFQIDTKIIIITTINVKISIFCSLLSNALLGQNVPLSKVLIH